MLVIISYWFQTFISQVFKQFELITYRMAKILILEIYIDAFMIGRY